MKTIVAILSFLLFISIINAQVSFGEPQLLNNGWKFAKGNPENASAVDFDDTRWRSVDLPHDWSVEGPYSPHLASATGYLPGGIGWYRKTFSTDENAANKRIYIYFEGVYRDGEVFINGTSLGMRPNGYISYLYDLTPIFVMAKSIQWPSGSITANLPILAGTPVRAFTAMFTLFMPTQFI
jgi:beta-galactosidase